MALLQPPDDLAMRASMAMACILKNPGLKSIEFRLGTGKTESFEPRLYRGIIMLGPCVFYSFFDAKLQEIINIAIDDIKSFVQVYREPVATEPIPVAVNNTVTDIPQ